MIVLDGHSLTLQQATAIASGTAVTIDPQTQHAVDAGRSVVEAIMHGDKAVYGVNTGFGFFANKRISHDQLVKVQDNIIQSHAAGFGPALSVEETRLAMALRLHVLLKGCTGVRFTLCQALLNLITAGIYPLIPEYGSVGASGDLAPLAHLALPLTGRGRVLYQGEEMDASAALAAAGLEPFVLAEKEGLGLINGTQVMLAVGGLALAEGLRLGRLADLVVALTYDAMMAHTEPLDPRIHELRGQTGQIASAHAIRTHLEGSYLYDPSMKRLRVQDSYSLRCAPQIHGPCQEALAYAETIISRELNAATDNPLTFTDTQEAISGGNFHGEALAMAFDFAAIALSELANVSERRLELLLNPHFSGLHAFLAPKEGLESGYMASQYLSASLVNEDKLLANPACTDSIPGNVGIEDFVSMGMTSARKLRQIVTNCRTVLAIEAMAAAAAIDQRGVKPLGKGSQRLYDAIRHHVKPLTEDRIVADDINGAVETLKRI